jgi:quinol monooxygenase YgiN
MVITEVEGFVPSSRWGELKAAYRAMTETLESSVDRTYLLQATDDPTRWRVATVWKSKEALDEYRRSVETPGAFVLYRGVGVEPKRMIFDVAEFAAQH